MSDAEITANFCQKRLPVRRMSGYGDFIASRSLTSVPMKFPDVFCNVPRNFVPRILIRTIWRKTSEGLFGRKTSNIALITDVLCKLYGNALFGLPLKNWEAFSSRSISIAEHTYMILKCEKHLEIVRTSMSPLWKAKLHIFERWRAVGGRRIVLPECWKIWILKQTVNSSKPHPPSCIYRE